MSLYNVPEASPSRIVGVFRFLLACPDGKATRARIEQIMAPESLTLEDTSDHSDDAETETSGRGVVQKAIQEALRLGLVQEVDRKSVAVSEKLDKDYIKQADRLLPLAILELASSPGNGNADLCRAMAWMLAQDVKTAPGTWQAIQGRGELVKDLDMNNARYGQLQHWGAYLGLVWRCGRERRPASVPDPTTHIKLRLKHTLGGRRREFTAPEFLQKLSQWIPVIDGGIYRAELESQGLLKPLATAHVSSALSQALLRLRDEGWIEATHSSDAEVRLLVSEDGDVRVSRILWIGGAKAV